MTFLDALRNALNSNTPLTEEELNEIADKFPTSPAEQSAILGSEIPDVSAPLSSTSGGLSIGSRSVPPSQRTVSDALYGKKAIINKDGIDVTKKATQIGKKLSQKVHHSLLKDNYQ